MSQSEVKSRAEEILFPNKNTCIPTSLKGEDIFLSVEQLRQLIVEKIVEGNSASNARPTLQELLDFGNSLISFLIADNQLQLYFFGSVCFQLNQIQLSLDSFELSHTENANIECALELLPIASRFACKHKADKFIFEENLFFAWWD